MGKITDASRSIMEFFKTSVDFEREMAQTIHSFKASKEYHDTKIAFDQETFNVGHGAGFEDCCYQVVARPSKADLSFLDEDEGEEEAAKELASPMIAER